MPSSLTKSRPFEPGTTGWTASDLDDPEIERQWFNGRYEIVEGILTKMPPAYFAGGNAAFNLAFCIKNFLREQGIRGRFSTEVDIVIDELRVARADVVMLTPADEASQKKAVRRARRGSSIRTRILIPPALVIESISPGHESHDKRTKRKWYSEFGIANYWIVDRFRRSLQCMVLRKGLYHDDVAGHGDEELRPSLFPGLVLSLKEIWES
ncbi:MAG TPA: Uma2 family endonuclease [Humisphaera sp.]|nr:Uma2 family endonuclease [Humisphaera sp.]